jgi:signal transduction histidine kinase
MHDTLAQGFASIVALGNAAQTELDADPASARRHLALITATAAENLGESRRIIAALAPGRLAGSSLTEAIRRTVDAFAAESGVDAELAVAGATRALPAAVDVVLLRVAQEALTNVRRHARAGRAEVRLAFDAAGVVLEVVDDGAGFDPVPAGTGSFGLAGMADRVAEVGGDLAVDARSGAGTRLTVRIPVPEQTEAGR